MKRLVAGFLGVCALACCNADNLKLTFVGDICCSAELVDIVAKGQRQFDDVFADVKPILAKSDFVVGNLETPLAGGGDAGKVADACFNSPDEFAVAVKRAGVNLVSTANNHSMDRGLPGLIRTLSVLDQIGLKHTGTYATRADADTVLSVDIKGVKFAFVSGTYGTNSENGRDILDRNEDWRIDFLRRQYEKGFCPYLPPPPKRSEAGMQRKSLYVRIKGGIKNRMIGLLRRALNKLSPSPKQTRLAYHEYWAECTPRSEITNELSVAYLERYLGKIRRAREVADVVVALPHIGGQFNPSPGYYQKFVVSKTLEAGADIVIANHAHVPMPIKWDNGGPLVVNALGNFCFTPYVGWFLDYVYSEYNTVLHVYVDTDSKRVAGYEYHLLKNVVESDGFAHPVLVTDLMDRVNGDYERERLMVESEAVMNIVGPQRPLTGVSR